MKIELFLWFVISWIVFAAFATTSSPSPSDIKLSPSDVADEASPSDEGSATSNNLLLPFSIGSSYNFKIKTYILTYSFDYRNIEISRK